MFLNCHGCFSLDPFSSKVASLKAMQCVKLRVRGRCSHGCVFVIAPLRSVTVRFVLRAGELSIFLLLRYRIIRQFFCVAMARGCYESFGCSLILWHFRLWSGKTAVSIQILWIDLFSCRFFRNDRALGILSEYALFFRNLYPRFGSNILLDEVRCLLSMLRE